MTGINVEQLGVKGAFKAIGFDDKWECKKDGFEFSSFHEYIDVSAMD